MVFAGTWNALEDIVVDTVGKYVYEMKSPMENASVHVIVDISVEGHTKVMTPPPQPPPLISCLPRSSPLTQFSA